MKERFVENGIEYIRCGDYYIPDIKLPKKVHYGKYGILREDFIKKHRKSFYFLLILKCKLEEYLAEIDKTCREQIEHIVCQIAENEGVNETLKATNQMEWVRRMNLIKSRAEEFVYAEYVYK